MAAIRKRGEKWQVQFRRKGQRSITRSFGHRKDAEVWSRQIEVQADRRDLPQQDDHRTLEKLTLADLVRKYRDNVSPKKRDCRNEMIVLNAFLRHPICSTPLSDLSSRDFVAYRDERLTQVKPITVRRQMSPLHNMFEVAREEWGLPIQLNPLDKVTLDYTGQRRERRLRPGEFERIVEATSACLNPYVLPIIRFAIETSMRRGEIIGMQWEHLDRSNNCLLIPHTKNGHSRTIPLGNRALAILDDLSDTQSKVFPISANAFRLAWERVRRRAGVEDLRFHDLRHEAISRLFEVGLTTPEVALISGHRDVRMLFRYTHPLRILIQQKLNIRSEPGISP